MNWAYVRSVHDYAENRTRKVVIAMDENEKTKKKVTARPKGQMTEEMPVLALRGLVLFPNMILHFDVGREKSVMALNEAIGGSRKIFLVTQRDFQDNDPDQSQLYQVGVDRKSVV